MNHTHEAFARLVATLGLFLWGLNLHNGWLMGSALIFLAVISYADT